MPPLPVRPNGRQLTHNYTNRVTRDSFASTIAWIPPEILRSSDFAESLNVPEQTGVRFDEFLPSYRTFKAIDPRGNKQNNSKALVYQVFSTEPHPMQVRNDVSLQTDSFPLYQVLFPNFLVPAT